MRVSVLAERVRIEVADDGPGFEATAVQPDARQESGWGLVLVDQLTDRWGVEPGPGARVWCELYRPRPERRRTAVPSGGSVRQRQRRASVQAIGAFLAEEAGAASYLRAQREALKGAVKRDGPGPVEFDESGFPIRQRTPRFLDRVARLLRP